MNRDRWRVVKGLFQRALRLPPAQWPEFLDRVCVGDAGLREDVASLLEEHEPGAVSLLGSADRLVGAERERLAREPGAGGDPE
jgi:hypothetical protein